MDPILSSFVLQMSAVVIGAMIAIIGAFSKCFRLSRCTKITCWGVACDREPLDVDSPAYLTPDESISVPIPKK
jgi:hypothetical protein